MSTIAALAGRRAFTRQALFRAPPRRFASSKVEEANLDKAGKRDPELYVRIPQTIEPQQSYRSNRLISRSFSVSCLVL
jgi:hypothetical protein